MNYAIGMKEYDASPFNRYVETSSFRNYMEGFKINPPELTCKGEELCTIEIYTYECECEPKVTQLSKCNNYYSNYKCACLDSSQSIG